jgi:hypothetical protein
MHLSRETYHAITKEAPRPEHCKAQYRFKVHECLQADEMLIYNNGDPIMFNAAANAIFGMFKELARRGRLAKPDRLETYLSIARRPIEVVSKAQIDFCREGTRVVGGKPHDLAITPSGEYSSSTGDI